MSKMKYVYRTIKMDEKEIDYNPKFRLILQTKLGNPHYKPEIQAQTTLINFTVTKDGLEDQLLADVMKVERPDLEEHKVGQEMTIIDYFHILYGRVKGFDHEITNLLHILQSNLTKEQNHYKIKLKLLEDELLEQLSSAEGDVLGDKRLVENLESSKKMAVDIVEKVSESRQASIKIDEAREHFRPVATRASTLYFIINDLHKINPIYQFSLKVSGACTYSCFYYIDPNFNTELVGRYFVSSCFLLTWLVTNIFYSTSVTEVPYYSPVTRSLCVILHFLKRCSVKY